MNERESHSNHESELIRRAQSGDESAYAEIFHRYHRLVRALLLSRTGCDPHTAEDLTQIAFLKVHTSLPNYHETDSNFEAWVMTLARNTATDYLRQRGRSKVELDPKGIDDSVRDREPTTEQIAIARMALQRVLEQLTPEERDTVENITGGDMTSEQYARKRGEKPSTPRKRLHDMRRKLRDEFGDPDDVV